MPSGVAAMSVFRAGQCLRIPDQAPQGRCATLNSRGSGLSNTHVVSWCRRGKNSEDQTATTLRHSVD